MITKTEYSDVKQFSFSLSPDKQANDAMLGTLRCTDWCLLVEEDVWDSDVCPLRRLLVCNEEVHCPNILVALS